jgi:membrane-anchored protein YejM (alkaline phosphatase superfamily)
MKAATIHELKQELTSLPQKELVELCLRLGRFKKENKELLTYLLYEANDETAYIASVKKEIDEQFEGMNFSHLYFVRKTLRKILRIIGKHTRYMGSKQAETEWLIYFCRRISELGIPVEKSTALVNLYNNQVKKIKTLIGTLHEDLQHDYLRELMALK